MGMRKTITFETPLLGGAGNFITTDPTDIQPPAAAAPAVAETVRTHEEELTATNSLMVDISGLSLGGLDAFVDKHGDAALAPCVDALMSQVDNPVRSIGGHNS